MNNFDARLFSTVTSQSAASQAGLRKGAPVAGTISSLDSLREHLQWAIELEHSTIPPYLCVLYSIEPGHNREAVEVISSVVVEMLHLTLAANLLNALGGRPRLDIPQMLPGYPRSLPHSDRSFKISLFRFGPEAIENFFKIEQPSPMSGPPEGDKYETIGQYEAIKQGFRDPAANVFCGDPARQVTDQHLYSGGGRIIAVADICSALAALDQIVEQGEGARHNEIWDGRQRRIASRTDQVAYYCRFQKIKLGRRFRRSDTPRSGPSGDPISTNSDAVRPMRTNPRTAHPVVGSPIRVAQEKFNHSYCALLTQLVEAFDGTPHTTSCD